MPEFALGAWSEDFFRGRVLILTSPGVGRQSVEYVVFGGFFRFSEVRYTHPDVLG